MPVVMRGTRRFTSSAMEIIEAADDGQLLWVVARKESAADEAASPECSPRFSWSVIIG
jgi:hypothetical protein